MIRLFVILVICATTVAAQTDDLDVQADADMQAVLMQLAGAMDDQLTLSFVDTGADVLVTGDVPDDALDSAHFLPDVVLVLLTDHDQGQAFIDFAVSPDGQQVLIDTGLLPDMVTITDQAGNTLDVAQPVRRVVSPYSLATYYVYATGAGETLVAAGYLGARDPQGAAAMERIDPRFPELSALNLSQEGTNVEMIAELTPDLVLSSARADWLEPVEELGIGIVRYEGETPDALKEAVLLTGQIFGPDAYHRAQVWVDAYDAVIEEVTDIVAESDQTPRVLFTGTEPTRVASGEMYQTAMIEAAGGESVSASFGGYWNDVNLEQIIVWNPDIIFVPPYGGATVEAITENAEWQLLEAVQQGRVFRVPKLVAPWDTPTQDSLLGIMWMAEKLYPDAFNLNCDQAVRAFYDTFYDYAILDDEIASLCSA